MADQLATEIIDKIKAQAEPGNEITIDTELEELGIHSLELTEIVFDLEEAYGIEIEMNTVEAWNKLKNVGDIVEATRALIAAKALSRHAANVSSSPVSADLRPWHRYRLDLAGDACRPLGDRRDHDDASL